MSANESNPPQKLWVCDNCEDGSKCELKNSNLSFVPQFCPGDSAYAIWQSQCQFQEDWKGQCTKNAIRGSLYCEEHSNTKCCSCGAQATHSCDETFQFVCGYPLCDNCVGITMNDRHIHTKKGDYYHGPLSGAPE